MSASESRDQSPGNNSCLIEFQEARQAFEQSGTNQRAYGLVRVLGRCMVHYVQVPSRVSELLSEQDLSNVNGLFVADLAKWTNAVDDLKSQWEAAQDDELDVDLWLGDRLCQSLLQHRIDSWFVELGLTSLEASSKEVTESLQAFDDALRAQSPTLCTVVTTTWYENLQRTFPDDAPSRPWILGRDLEAAYDAMMADVTDQMPEGDAWRAVQVASSAPLQSRLPPAFAALNVEGFLAAEPKDIDIPPGPVMLRWLSPDKQYRAHLNLPGQLPDDSDEKPINFLLYFVRTTDDQPADELVGKSLQLDDWIGVVGTDQRVYLLLEDIRSLTHGLLFVADDLWMLLPDEVN